MMREKLNETDLWKSHFVYASSEIRKREMTPTELECRYIEVSPSCFRQGANNEEDTIEALSSLDMLPRLNILSQPACSNHKNHSEETQYISYRHQWRGSGPVGSAGTDVGLGTGFSDNPVLYT